MQQRSFGMESMARVDNFIYFFSMNFNGMFRLDLITEEQIFIGAVPWEEDKPRLYKDMIYIKDKLYLIPIAASAIAIFDIKNETFENRILIEQPVVKQGCYDINYKYISAKLVGNEIFIFGLTHPSIGVINVEDNSIKYLNSWIETYEKKYKTNINLRIGQWYFRWYPCVYNSNMYVPVGFSNKLMTMNAITKKFDFVEVGYNDTVYANLQIHNNVVTITSTSADFHVVMYRLNDNLQEIFAGNKLGQNYMRSKLIWKDDEAYLIPFEKGNILKVGLYNSEINVKEKLSVKNKMYAGDVESENIEYAYFDGDNTIAILGEGLNVDKSFKVISDSKYVKRYNRFILDEQLKVFNGKLYEGEHMCLKTYVNSL